MQKENVSKRGRIGTAVQRLLIWGVQKLISFMKGRNMGLRKDSGYWCLINVRGYLHLIVGKQCLVYERKKYDMVLRRDRTNRGI